MAYFAHNSKWIKEGPRHQNLKGEGGEYSWAYRSKKGLSEQNLNSLGLKTNNWKMGPYEPEIFCIAKGTGYSGIVLNIFLSFQNFLVEYLGLLWPESSVHQDVIWAKMQPIEWGKVITSYTSDSMIYKEPKD